MGEVSREMAHLTHLAEPCVQPPYTAPVHSSLGEFQDSQSDATERASFVGAGHEALIHVILALPALSSAAKFTTSAILGQSAAPFYLNEQ